jgi:hypothetical protein
MKGRVRRWLKEISALKTQFGGAVVAVTEDQHSAVLVFPSLVHIGTPLVLTVSLSEQYPFKPPSVEITGISNSFFGEWSPQNRLVEYISLLLGELRDAENNPSFQQGLAHIGKNFAFQLPSAINTSICGNCKNTVPKYVCGRCNNTYYCNARCQQAHFDIHKTACNALPI